MENFNYQPNDIDSDIFLSELPLSLVKENIISQFEDPLEYRKKDHITTFINMYLFSKENMDPFEDDKDVLMQLRYNFYSFMQDLFKSFLGIGFVNFDDMSEEDQDTLIHYTYRFFLINIKKNFVCLILNYIEKNREEYIFDEDRRKDVTTLSFKREITDPKDIYILSNLSDIIDSILGMDITVDDFFENCDDDDPYLETMFVSSKYDQFIITGNFVENYINMIDSDFKSEIESKIRNKILKKYKKK